MVKKGNIFNMEHSPLKLPDIKKDVAALFDLYHQRLSTKVRKLSYLMV